MPKQQFKANLKKVLQHRSNLLDDLFETEFSSVVDAKGEKVMMPLTSAKHLSTLVHIVCEKRGYDEDNIKIAIGGFSPRKKLNERSLQRLREPSEPLWSQNGERS